MLWALQMQGAPAAVPLRYSGAVGVAAPSFEYKLKDLQHTDDKGNVHAGAA